MSAGAKKEPSDARRADEHSSVRDTQVPSQRISSPELRVRQRRISSPEISSPRDLRIEAKVARAEEMLSALPPGDPRARLLEVALLRHDEVLLEGILASLERDEK